MPDAPTIAQLILVALSALLFVSSAAASLRAGGSRIAAALATLGLVLAVVTQAVHSFDRHNWLPLQDNFDALLWLAILIAGVSLYLQGRSALRRIDWIASPIVVLLLAGAAAFGSARPHTYTDSAWAWTHLISSFASPVAFAFAACAGVLYLVLRRKLRSKDHAPVDSSFGSLERLERMNYTAVKVGFALLTIGLISGLTRTLGHHTNLGDHWFVQPKVLLSFAAYVLYAIVLHSPINPTFRGKKTAVLSIAGFVLMLGILVVVQ